jgi:beta-N-acetylhexosaminidase
MMDTEPKARFDGRDLPDLEEATGLRLMLAFQGHTLPPGFGEMLSRRTVAGVTLFRPWNVRDPEQVRELTAALQGAAGSSHPGDGRRGGAAQQLPLLIAADQEGGTLNALAGTTTFPGNMALGATSSPDLARRVGFAIGRELSAQGVNVNYAPVCDVNINPANPVIGTRSFGEDPQLAAGLAAAMVEGMQAAGVAATAKHFPGHGDTSTDSHHALPVLDFDEERLRRVELPPFSAAIKAGVKLIMSAHLALPALTGNDSTPATLSVEVMTSLLRAQLGFSGVSISDALDMGAIPQGPQLASRAVEAAQAGNDLLLLMGSGEVEEQIYRALLRAAQEGMLSTEQVAGSARRVLALKSWVGRQEQPPLSVVGCEEHRALALQVAAHATTLVCDGPGLLPLRLSPDAPLLVIVPRPADLTPADTSSYDTPSPALHLRNHHPLVDEVTVPIDPQPEEIAYIRERAAQYRAAVVCTINALDHPGQAALANALFDVGIPVVAVALRLPYDLQAYPAAGTYVCTYSLQDPSLAALADALFGKGEFRGRLPVSVAR